MLRTGLLDRTDHLPHKPDRAPKSYCCPIPSQLDHTLDEIGTSREAMDEVLAGEGLAHGTITPRAERFRPTWPDSGDGAG